MDDYALQWNHNPDTTKYSISGGLALKAATVTVDLYQARNTITHRILGPTSAGTILLDVSKMTDGDRAGLAIFRDQSGWIGVRQTGSTRQIVIVNGINMNSDWTTNSTGTVATYGPTLTGTQVWLQVTADIKPGGSNTAKFAYSLDGSTFTTLSPSFTMDTTWEFFMGYRFGIFNYATAALGGQVTVKSFTLCTSGNSCGASTGSSTSTTASSGSSSTTTSSTSTPTSGTVAQYGQCGGIGSVSNILSNKYCLIHL
jgi:beta-xylosidase